MIIHIVGLDIQVGSQRRQRCAWCGTLLDDFDLTRVAAPIEYDSEGKEIPWNGPPSWEVGALIAVDGGVKYVVNHEDGDKLPEECCGSLPPELTSGLENPKL